MTENVMRLRVSPLASLWTDFCQPWESASNMERVLLAASETADLIGCSRPFLTPPGPPQGSLGDDFHHIETRVPREQGWHSVAGECGRWASVADDSDAGSPVCAC